jgi:predicted nucleic-acid-binding protein
LIGVDTNILLRYLLDDDPIWSPVVTDFVDNRLTPERQGYVNLITLVELVWTLRRRPDYDRSRLAAVVESLLSSDSIVLAEAHAVERALTSFRTGNAGFADYLIAELNEAAGASPTVTIDRKAGKALPFTPLSQGA